jgi:hypothetical protein
VIPVRRHASEARPQKVKWCGARPWSAFLPQPRLSSCRIFPANCHSITVLSPTISVARSIFVQFAAEISRFTAQGGQMSGAQPRLVGPAEVQNAPGTEALHRPASQYRSRQISGERPMLTLHLEVHHD